MEIESRRLLCRQCWTAPCQVAIWQPVGLVQRRDTRTPLLEAWVATGKVGTGRVLENEGSPYTQGWAAGGRMGRGPLMAVGIPTG